MQLPKNNGDNNKNLNENERKTQINETDLHSFIYLPK